MKNKMKIEKDGYTFIVESDSGICASEALIKLFIENRNHPVFSDCQDGILHDFVITGLVEYPKPKAIDFENDPPSEKNNFYLGI